MTYRETCLAQNTSLHFRLHLSEALGRNPDDMPPMLGGLAAPPPRIGHAPPRNAPEFPDATSRKSEHVECTSRAPCIIRNGRSLQLKHRITFQGTQRQSNPSFWPQANLLATSAVFIQNNSQGKHFDPKASRPQGRLARNGKTPK